MNSKAETIINESNTEDVFEFILSMVISNTQKSLAKGSSWTNYSVVNYNINIAKYQLLAVISNYQK